MMISKLITVLMSNGNSDNNNSNKNEKNNNKKYKNVLYCTVMYVRVEVVRVENTQQQTLPVLSKIQNTEYGIQKVLKMTVIDIANTVKTVEICLILIQNSDPDPDPLPKTQFSCIYLILFDSFDPFSYVDKCGPMCNYMSHQL